MVIFKRKQLCGLFLVVLVVQSSSGLWFYRLYHAMAQQQLLGASPALLKLLLMHGTHSIAME